MGTLASSLRSSHFVNSYSLLLFEWFSFWPCALGVDTDLTFEVYYLIDAMSLG